MIRLSAFCLLFIFLLCSPGYSFFKHLPDPDETEFSLLTVGVGSGLEKRFGHTILSVTDKRSGERRLLNWGTFDFEAPYYALNFLKGFLRYWVSESTFDGTIRYYRLYENRSIVEDQLRLSTKQKSHFLQLLADRLRPDGIYFMYDFFYNNCSTIPRDLIDEVISHRLAEATHKIPATMNLRAYVRRDLSEWAVVAYFLDIMLNREVDKPIDAWVEMFVPLMLRTYLSQLPQYDDLGNPLPNTKLLTDQKELVAGGNYPSSRVNLFLCSSVGGLVLLGLCFLLSLQGSARAKILLASASIIWGLFAGFLGAVLFLGWSITEHVVLSHNANLWVFWPFDFAFVILGIKLLRNKGRPTVPNFLWYFTLIHLLALLVFVGLYFAGLFMQDVSNVVYYLCPVAALYYVLLLRSLSLESRISSKNVP